MASVSDPLTFRRKAKSRQLAAVIAAPECEALALCPISAERCGKVRKPPSLLAGRSDVRKLDQVLRICDVRDATGLRALKVLP